MTVRRTSPRMVGATAIRGILEPEMIDPEPFQRAELESALRQLKILAQSGPPAAENAGAALQAFSHVVTAFVVALERDPNASPRELLLAAGQAHSRLETLQRAFDGAMDQLERLPFRLHLDGASLPEHLPRGPSAPGCR